MLEQLLRIFGLDETREESGISPPSASVPGLSRRDFLRLTSAVAGAAASGLWPSRAEAQDHSLEWDVIYETEDDVFWSENIASVLDTRDQVAGLLGPRLAGQLRVVRGSGKYEGRWGVVYDRDGNEKSTKEVAKRHSRYLAGTEKAAQAIRDKDYETAYNVEYKVSDNLTALQRDYKTVYATLGEELGRDLVIEKKGRGMYALVYQRRGNLESTRRAAESHQKKLRKGFDPKAAMERSNPVVYGERSYLREEDEETRERKPRVEQPIKQPVKPQPPSEKPQKGTDALEGIVERHIQTLRNKGRLADDERISCVVYSMPDRAKLVSINEDIPRQAASMMKVCVMTAIMHEASRGNLKYTSTVRRHVKQMIQKSDNASTDWLMRRLKGPSGVQQLLKRHYGGIFEQTAIVEYISGGRTYRNKASAHDYSRFLNAMWNDQLPMAREMRRVMSLPKRDRIYDGCPDIPNGTGVYNKTGSTAMLCGDMGILNARRRDGKRQPYAIAVIIEKDNRAGNYFRWIKRRGDVIRSISNLVYQEMRNRYNLV